MDYRVSFFKVTREKNEKTREEIKTGQEFLGMITVDDHGTGQNFTLTAKAFRVCPAAWAHADKVVLEPVKR